MRQYDSLRDDPPLHGGSFVKRHGYGGEVLNFQRNGKYYYGYAQARHGTIGIDRLGAKGRPYVDGALVIWRARSLTGSVVVGWYRDARVYRERQEGNPKRRVRVDGESWIAQWHFRAPTSSSRLLPPRFRTFKWPASTPGFGSTTFVSYLQGSSSKVRAYRRELLTYIKQVESGRLGPPARGKKPNPDQERNLRIEAVGRRVAMKYYDELGFTVRSVEKEKCGYDLVAERDNEELLVEIKATATERPADVCVGLTPNEFKASRALRTDYRICIVFDALDRPEIREYQWVSKAQCWLDLNSSTRLGVLVVQAANLTMLHPSR